MTSLLRISLLCLSLMLLVGSGAFQAIQSDPQPAEGERAALQVLESASPDLGLQRAGLPSSPSLDGDEIDALRTLQARSPELAAMRAGDISNETLITILLVLGILVLLAILL